MLSETSLPQVELSFLQPVELNAKFFESTVKAAEK